MKKILFLLSFLSLFLSGNSQVIRGRKLEAETIAWANKVTKIDKEFPYDVIYNVDVFIKSLKTNLGSNYAKIQFLLLPVGESLNGAIIPILTNGSTPTAISMPEYCHNPTFGIVGGAGVINSGYRPNQSPVILSSQAAVDAGGYVWNNITDYSNNNGSTYFFHAMDGGNDAFGNPNRIELSQLNQGMTNYAFTQYNGNTAGSYNNVAYTLEDGNFGFYYYTNSAGIFKNDAYITGFGNITIPSSVNQNLALMGRNNSGTYTSEASITSSIHLMFFGAYFPNSEVQKITTALTAFKAAQQKYYRSFRNGSVYNVHLWAGQSLSTGTTPSSTTAIVSTTQPYSNKMLSSGVRSSTASNASAFNGVAVPYTGLVPLVEQANSNFETETPCSGFANKMSHYGGGYTCVMANHGRTGTSYAGLKRQQTPWGAFLKQAMAIYKYAKADGYTTIFRGVHITHGEADNAGSVTYETDLATWQSDYAKDIKNISGQTYFPAFVDQMSSWYNMSGQTVPNVPLRQLTAVETAYAANPTRPNIFIVCPKYFLSYFSGDGIHLANAHQYRWLGEYHAKAAKKVFVDNQVWTGVRPASVSRTGATIDISMYVEVPPLQFNTTLVSSVTNNGFEYFAGTGGNTPTISSVTILNDAVTTSGVTTQTVRVTLSATPTGSGQKIRYAYTAPATLSGPTTGPRGNLCDSDNTTSPNGYDLRNWCVTFEKAVP